MVYGVQTILQSRYWRTEVDNPSKNLTDGLFSHTVKHTANQRNCKHILNFIIWRPNKTHSTTAPVSLPAVKMVYSSPPTTSDCSLIPKNAGISHRDR